MLKEITLLASFFFSIAFLSSCTKGSGSDPVPASRVGNFTVQIMNRQAGQALISWTKPTVPAGSGLTYRVYLSSNLLAQNITDTSYTLINLLGNTVYSGRVVAYISPADSAVANFNIPQYTTPPSSDSVFVLSMVTDAGGLRLMFDYDTLNKRLKSWAKTYASFNYDSTKIFYDPSGKVLSLVRKTTISTPFVNVPNVFEYDGQGRVSKVYHKRIYTTEESYAYNTTVNFPLNFLYDLDSYDSLNYDAKNRVSSVYSFKSFNGNIAVPGFYTSYKLISYSPSNDSLTSRIITYTRNSSNNFDASTLDFNTYNNKLNPYYLLFRKFYLMGVENFITTPTFLPYYYFGYNLNALLTASPYICTVLNTSYLAFSYNADGLVSRCINGADFSEWVNFYYAQVKK